MLPAPSLRARVGHGEVPSWRATIGAPGGGSGVEQGVERRTRSPGCIDAGRSAGSERRERSRPTNRAMANSTSTIISRTSAPVNPREMADSSGCWMLR